MAGIVEAAAVAAPAVAAPAVAVVYSFLGCWHRSLGRTVRTSYTSPSVYYCPWDSRRPGHTLLCTPELWVTIVDRSIVASSLRSPWLFEPQFPYHRLLSNLAVVNSRCYVYSRRPMEKLSGLILDFYDDKNREIALPLERLSDLTKEAHALTAEEHARLPDDLYALVLMDGDVTLRKFACVDPGNTAVSIEYFLKTAHKLPVEAQKVAARNLITACGWYGITPAAELEKIALPTITGALNLAQNVLTAKNVAGEVRSGFQKAKSGVIQS